MNNVMTIEEMEKAFPSEWLLILDPEVDEYLEVRSGTVACHSKDREEVYRKAVELRPKRFASHYTGTRPADTVIVV